MKTMVEVFKTDVQQRRQAQKLLKLLAQSNPVCRINFDLEDCDRILRIEGKNLCCNKIIELLNLNGHHCEVLT